MDGIITQVQLVPSEEPGSSTLHITGEDVSLMMDLEDEQSSHPAVPDYAIVLQLVQKYARYGLIPPLPPATTPAALNPRNLLEERTERPADLTDRAYIQELARLYGFVFYVTPGPAPNVNTVHWGPPSRLPIPEGTLSVNMGPASNVESVDFRVDSLRREAVTFVTNGREQTVSRPGAARAVPLTTDVPEARRRRFLPAAEPTRVASRAQGQVDEAFDNGVVASGKLDALRYSGLLKARTIVGLRGAGRTHDGLYYVKSVTHHIAKGRYTQDFTLSREGTGTTTPLLPT
jgi:hypothetical protein